jgi:hypothetical protein
VLFNAHYVDNAVCVEIVHGNYGIKLLLAAELNN